MMSAPTRIRTGRRARSRASTIAYYVVSGVLAAVFVFPLGWVLLSSVTGPQATRTAGGGVGLDNYSRVAEFGSGVLHYLGNSIIVSAITVLGTLAITFFGGYAFARLRFPGKNVLFLAALAILMVPYTSLLIPLYVLLGWLGLQDSLIGLSLVLITLQLPFGLFMMRNSFEALPAALEEAALMDGCSRTVALFRVLLPGTIPGIVTTALFAFFASWNEFIAPLIFLTSGERFTLPVALVNLRSGSLGAIDYGALQAGVVISAIPCIIVFLLLQRYYVRGFTSGALKG
jgi:multiple sugar transport system permease protein